MTFEKGDRVEYVLGNPRNYTPGRVGKVGTVGPDYHSSMFTNVVWGDGYNSGKPTAHLTVNLKPARELTELEKLFDQLKKAIREREAATRAKEIAKEDFRKAESAFAANCHAITDIKNKIESLAVTEGKGL